MRRGVMLTVAVLLVAIAVQRTWLLDGVGALQGWGWCLRCEHRWNWRQEHSTPYAPDRLMFPLCQPCWEQLGTAHARHRYYEQLVVEWERTGYEHGVPARAGFMAALQAEEEGRDVRAAADAAWDAARAAPGSGPAQQPAR